jgi:hypothetical protein
MKTVQIMPVLASLLFAAACGEAASTKPAPIATVTVTAGTSSLAPGEFTQLVASAATAAGQAVSGAQFSWLSDAPAVATVDASGRVTGVSPGTAAISATAGTVRGAVTLTVKAPVPQTASVRFVNWTTGTTGSGGFTANGQFVTGSAVAPGQASSTCTQLAPGKFFLSFGLANASGTALNGNPLAVLNEETISAGGDYTIVAAGPATSPLLLLLVNNFSGSLGTGSAAVRFMSLAPTTGGTVFNYVFYLGDIGATSPLALNMPFGIHSAYSIVPSGANKYSALRSPGNVTVDPGSTITLPPASASTIALIPDASGGLRLTRLPRCF